MMNWIEAGLSQTTIGEKKYWFAFAKSLVILTDPEQFKAEISVGDVNSAWIAEG
jgi:hypothetical protein